MLIYVHKFLSHYDKYKKGAPINTALFLAVHTQYIYNRKCMYIELKSNNNDNGISNVKTDINQIYGHQNMKRNSISFPYLVA